MENVLLRFEQASSKKLPVTSATPRSALIAPLMGMVIEPLTVCANASVAEAVALQQRKELATASSSSPPTSPQKLTQSRHPEEEVGEGLS